MDETAQAKAGHTDKDVGIGTDDGTGKGRNAHGMILGRVCTGVTGRHGGRGSAGTDRRAGPCGRTGTKVDSSTGRQRPQAGGGGCRSRLGRCAAPAAGTGTSGTVFGGTHGGNGREGNGPVLSVRGIGSIGPFADSVRLSLSSCSQAACPCLRAVLPSVPCPWPLTVLAGLERCGQKKEHPGMLLLKVTHGAGVVRPAPCGHEGKKDGRPAISLPRG